jgi:hypothetical protein
VEEEEKPESRDKPMKESVQTPGGGKAVNMINNKLRYSFREISMQTVIW